MALKDNLIRNKHAIDANNSVKSIKSIYINGQKANIQDVTKELSNTRMIVQ